MSYTQSDRSQHTLTAALREHFPYRKNQIDTFRHVLLATLEGKHVLQQSIADRIPGTAQNRSKLRTVERFFSGHPLSQLDTAKFLLKSLPDDEKLTLILDRTNWKLGGQDINILMLAVLDPGTHTALPLCWTNLDHPGNSNGTTRLDLLERVLDVLPLQRIKMLLGDREFIGAHWLELLYLADIPFCVRIRENTRLDDLAAKSWFDNVQHGELRTIAYEVNVSELPLWVEATRSVLSELVIVISNVSDVDLLASYGRRWSIECLFKNLKSLGFRLEDTHMTDARHLERLICVLAILFVWAVKMGEGQPIKVKKHGRRARSVFRVGISRLIELLKQPLNLFLEALQAIFPKLVGY